MFTIPLQHLKMGKMENNMQYQQQKLDEIHFHFPLREQ